MSYPKGRWSSTLGTTPSKDATGEGNYKTILENLCHLEINTIIKDDMTGQKMPAPEVALADLAEEYATRLTALGTSIAAEPVGPLRYRTLHDAADKLLESLKTSDGEHKDAYWLVARIRNNSEQIVAVFDAVAARTKAPVVEYMRADAVRHQLELLADEIVVVRKAWELGLEEIVLQTVIQLDGDVVHRVKADYATKEHASCSRSTSRRCTPRWRTGRR